LEVEFRKKLSHCNTEREETLNAYTVYLVVVNVFGKMAVVELFPLNFVIVFCVILFPTSLRGRLVHLHEALQGTSFYRTKD
jgi:hypothetical protein